MPDALCIGAITSPETGDGAKAGWTGQLADHTLSNSDELQGAVAIVKRGACSFVEKALRVAEAGAAGMVVVISKDKMIAPGDSAQEGGGVQISVVGLRSINLATLLSCERAHFVGFR